MKERTGPRWTRRGMTPAQRAQNPTEVHRERMVCLTALSSHNNFNFLKEKKGACWEKKPNKTGTTEWFCEILCGSLTSITLSRSDYLYLWLPLSSASRVRLSPRAQYFTGRQWCMYNAVCVPGGGGVKEAASGGGHVLHHSNEPITTFLHPIKCEGLFVATSHDPERTPQLICDRRESARLYAGPANCPSPRPPNSWRFRWLVRKAS